MPTSPAANAPVVNKRILFGIAKHRIQISIRFKHSNTRLRKAQSYKSYNLRVFLRRCFLATGALAAMAGNVVTNRRRSFLAVRDCVHMIKENVKGNGSAEDSFECARPSRDRGC